MKRVVGKDAMVYEEVRGRGGRRKPVPGA